jgi:hypothetical protein
MTSKSYIHELPIAIVSYHTKELFARSVFGPCMAKRLDSIQKSCSSTTAPRTALR